MSVIITMNMFYGVYTQGLVKYEDDSERFTSSMQGLMTTLCVIWFFIYIFTKNYAYMLLKIDFSKAFFMIVIIWSGGIFEFWATQQRINYKYKSLFIITLLMSVLQFILCLCGIIYSHNKSLAWIIGVAVSQFLICILLFLNQIKKERHLYSSHYWKYALCFSIPLIPHYLSQIVLSVSDRIMINNMIGTEAAGVYSFAYHVAMIMTMIQGAILNVVNPWIYRQIKNKTVENISIVAYGTMTIVAMGNIAIIAFSPEMVSLLAPQAYHNAIWIIPPVSMGCFFMYCYSLFADFSFYYNKTMSIMIASVAGAILNVVLNYLLIPLFGEFVAGYTTMISYLVYIFMHYRMMCRTCYNNGVSNAYNKKILMLIIVSFIFIGFMYLIMYNSICLRICVTLTLVVIIIYRRKYFLETIFKLMSLNKF
ncbi:MAG: polysaccharide biosynthesis C-terminal domain-containing protein, partial [Butyrivibrio sp.]|nr:polysaccharide biosynthesis C-terminal domain-containing protein [Butyrivibrio sp.]